MENIAVDLGYGYVKAISSSGKRVIFPSLVGKGYDRGITNILGDTPNDLLNIHVEIKGEDYFVGELANESRSLSRIFERERFNHMYTHILLNTAIQLVTDGRGGSVNLSTGLPLDFYQAQAKDFQTSITGIQPHIEWKSGPLVSGAKQVNIERALVFPQGASAIFSALINHDGKYTYPHLMNQGTLIGLVDIGFRTTDFVVVEIQKNGSFIPKAKLSGTVDDGVNNLYRDIRQAYKTKTGGADLSEHYISRIIKDEQLTYKGNKIDFSNIIQSSKKSIATNIVRNTKGSSYR